MRKIDIVQIQAIYAKNEPLHAYLKSKGLNKQSNIFFTENGRDDYSNIIMLSASGLFYRFVVENGKYSNILFNDQQLLVEAIRITVWAVNSGKYPYYEETLKQLKRNLNYAQPSQGLF